MRAASYTDTKIWQNSYHSYPSEQHRELKKDLSLLPPDTLFSSVQIDYSLYNEDGCQGEIGNTWNSIPVREVLRLIECAPPKKNNPLGFEEVKRCWMLNPQDKA